MFKLRIAQYLIIPITLALVVALSGWFISFKETQQLRLIEASNYKHLNDITSFKRLSSGYSSLLIISDLIVGSQQTFLVESYLNQSEILAQQIRKSQNNDQWCCKKTALDELGLSLSAMEKIVLRSAIAPSNDLTISPDTLLSSLDSHAQTGLNALTTITEAQAQHAHTLSDIVEYQTIQHRQTLLLVWSLGTLSLLLLWWLISKTITIPIKFLSNAAEEALETGHFTNQARGPKEIVNLNRSLERLTNQFEKELDAERIKIQEQEKITRSQLWDVAHIDPITRIGNGNLFEQHFNRLINNEHNEQQNFNVCVIDVNEFKNVTHMFGHLSGNNLLISIAKILKESVSGQGIACRGVGDEFGLIIKPALTAKQQDLFFKRIIDQCNQIAFSEDAQTGAQISVGIAEYPTHGNNVRTLLKSAQTAMFRAQREKFNGSCWRQFHAGMDADRHRLLNLKDGISKAIDEQAFELYFQPVIDSESQTIISAEALLRWPDGPPGVTVPEIISVAERSGLILQLSEFIIDQACQMLMSLDKQGLTLSVAVNISPIQFRYQNLTELILQRTQQYGVSPKRLIIEITESTFLEDIERTQTTLKILQAIGVSIAIDDFGTGYSSLSYLQELPINWIKIDQSFISTIVENKNNLEIVRAVIQMGHAMGIGLVAEGVETDRQNTLLTKLKCERLQGYLISKPIAGDQFLDFVAQQYHPATSLGKLD
ncbi:MAG: bifunctional diguanylate cyclase/phosphodiesterase [Pseudomonadales bacterium]|nr:bifunctional diguanylate cyclase/phosphodiesterase [Pseudomonadales bacterium]